MNWKRVRNPSRKRWPGVWIGWTRDREEGQAHQSTLHAYVGREQADRILAEVRIGKRKGHMP